MKVFWGLGTWLKCILAGRNWNEPIFAVAQNRKTTMAATAAAAAEMQGIQSQQHGSGAGFYPQTRSAQEAMTQQSAEGGEGGEGGGDGGARKKGRASADESCGDVFPPQAYN